MSALDRPVLRAITWAHCTHGSGRYDLGIRPPGTVHGHFARCLLPGPFAEVYLRDPRSAWRGRGQRAAGRAGVVRPDVEFRLRQDTTASLQVARVIPILAANFGCAVQSWPAHHLRGVTCARYVPSRAGSKSPAGVAAVVGESVQRPSCGGRAAVLARFRSAVPAALHGPQE
jgi:hypothetical protein